MRMVRASIPDAAEQDEEPASALYEGVQEVDRMRGVRVSGDQIWLPAAQSKEPLKVFYQSINLSQYKLCYV